MDGKGSNNTTHVHRTNKHKQKLRKKNKKKIRKSIQYKHYVHRKKERGGKKKNHGRDGDIPFRGA